MSMGQREDCRFEISDCGLGKAEDRGQKAGDRKQRAVSLLVVSYSGDLSL